MLAGQEHFRPSTAKNNLDLWGFQPEPPPDFDKKVFCKFLDLLQPPHELASLEFQTCRIPSGKQISDFLNPLGCRFWQIFFYGFNMFLL
jgi:hypothetical protein